MGIFVLGNSTASNKLELNMSTRDGPTDEREEGEIIDEYEDIISSDEEFSMRQRIVELEEKNAELEKIANISGVYGHSGYDYMKKDSSSHHTDRYPLISIDISDDEEYPPAPPMSRIGKRRKSLQHSCSRRSHRRRKKSSPAPPAPLYRPADKLLLSMFHERVAANSSHSSKRKRKSKKTHSNKSSRRKSREYYVSDSDGDYTFDTYNVDVDDGYENLYSSDGERSYLNREELRVALARNTHHNEQHVSLKDRLIRRKENTDTLNEKTMQDPQEIIEEVETKVDSHEEKAETEDNLEEQELRIIALRSAVMRKHMVRKKRNENVAYSPSDFDEVYKNITVSPSLNNIDDTEACNSMEISPVPSPKMILSDEEGMDTKPIDMDIANSDSDSDLLSYEKWVPIEQIPLPNGMGMSAELYAPTPMRYSDGADRCITPHGVRFESASVSPANLDSEVEGEELALRALLLAKMNSPRVNKAVKEERPKVEDVRTPDPDTSLEAEVLRDFLINNMKKKTRPKHSSASVLKEAVRRLKAGNASISPTESFTEIGAYRKDVVTPLPKTAEETEMDLGQAITEMARVQIGTDRDTYSKKEVQKNTNGVVPNILPVPAEIAVKKEDVSKSPEMGVEPITTKEVESCDNDVDPNEIVENIKEEPSLQSFTQNKGLESICTKEYSDNVEQSGVCVDSVQETPSSCQNEALESTPSKEVATGDVAEAVEPHPAIVDRNESGEEENPKTVLDPLSLNKDLESDSTRVVDVDCIDVVESDVAIVNVAENITKEVINTLDIEIRKENGVCEVHVEKPEVVSVLQENQHHDTPIFAFIGMLRASVAEEELNSDTPGSTIEVVNEELATNCKEPTALITSEILVKKSSVQPSTSEKEMERKPAPPSPIKSAKISPSASLEQKKIVIQKSVPKAAVPKAATPISMLAEIKVEKPDKPAAKKPQPLPKKNLPPAQKTMPKPSTQPATIRTKIVKPNKVINQQSTTDLKRKSLDTTAKPSIPMKKLKPDEPTNRLITTAEMPQVKKLIIQLRASDTESEYSADDYEDDFDVDPHDRNFLNSRRITVGNEYYDIASPISLPMESPCDTPTRAASPLVNLTQIPQANVEKSIVNDFFEAKLDQFLKNVRSKVTDSSAKQPVEDDLVPTPSPVINTPVAVRHLPEASQQEYRSLIYRMKMLERRKQAKSLQVILKTTSGTTSGPSRTAMTEGDSKTLVRKVLVKNASVNTAKPICDKNVVEVSPIRKIIPQKPKTPEKLAITTKTQAPILSPPKQEPSKENLLVLYENSCRKTGTSIITNLDKSIELVMVAKEAKMEKLKHEYRLRELRKEMDEVQRNLQKQQERITQIYPEICSTHRMIESLKTRRVKINKAVTALGRSIIGPSYSMNNDQKSIISEKSKKLAAEIKFVNNMKLSDVEKWNNTNRRSSLNDATTTTTTTTPAAPAPKDLNSTIVKPSTAINNDMDNNSSSINKVPVCDSESPVTTITIDTNLPEVTQQMEPKLNDTIVPEQLSNKDEDEQNDSTNGHEEALEIVPIVDKQTYDSSEVPEDHDEQKEQMGGAKLQDYVSPLSHLRDERQINPNGIVCPYQLMGQCDDKDCKYMHLDD